MAVTGFASAAGAHQLRCPLVPRPQAQEMIKKGPQQMMAEMAMKQMMGSMKGPAGGAANPFAGGMPPGFPGAGM